MNGKRQALVVQHWKALIAEAKGLQSGLIQQEI